MIEFVIEYWLEFLFGGMVAVLGTWCRSLTKKLKEKQIKEDALYTGIRAILHDMLFQTCEKYISLGYIPIEEAEKIVNREKITYEAYTGLNGNGTGTEIHNRFVSLPYKNSDTV